MIQQVFRLILPSPPVQHPCRVCLDTVPPEKTVLLAACGHRTCRSCLQRYMRTQIAGGHVPLRCYEEATSFWSTTAAVCGVEIDRSDISKLVGFELHRKYKRLQFNRAHPVDGRQCPHCDFSQVWPNGETQRVCVCGLCRKSFCFIHGAAHGGAGCHAYLQQTEHLTIATLTRVAKRCPQCKVPVEKNGERGG